MQLHGTKHLVRGDERTVACPQTIHLNYSPHPLFGVSLVIMIHAHIAYNSSVFGFSLRNMTPKNRQAPIAKQKPIRARKSTQEAQQPPPPPQDNPMLRVVKNLCSHWVDWKNAWGVQYTPFPSASSGCKTWWGEHWSYLEFITEC